MRYRVVCISHSLGAGGDAAGKLIAERLGFQYLDDEIVVAAAGSENIDPKVVRTAEQQRSFVGRLLDRLGDAGAVEAYAAAGFVPSGITPQERMHNTELHRTLIRESVQAAAGRGEAVIVSHAASLALADQADVLRVFVTASPETRAKRLQEAGGAFDDGPARVIRSDDAARADYLKRFYGVDRELPTHYDLVLNTDALTTEDVATIVVELVRSP